MKLGLLMGAGFATAIFYKTDVMPTMKNSLVFGVIIGTAQGLGVVLGTHIVFEISKLTWQKY